MSTLDGSPQGRKYCPHEISRSGVCEGHCRTDERELDETAEPFAAMPEDAILSVREMDGITFDLMMDGSIRAHGRTGVYQVANYRDWSGLVVSGRLRCTCLGWRATRPCRHEKAAVKLALTCTKQEEVF